MKVVLKRSSTDNLFVLGLLIILWLLPFVRIEPAPVDYLVWIMGGILFLKRPRSFWHKIPTLARCGILLLIVSHVSLFWVPDLQRGIFFILATLEMLVLLVLYKSKKLDYRWFKSLAYAYLGGSIIAGILGIAAFFGYIPYREIFIFGDMRAMVLFQDPNVFGAHLVPAIILVTALTVEEDTLSYKKLIYMIIMSFILTLGILLAGSRAAWGGLLVGLCSYLVFYLFYKGQWSKLLQRGGIVCIGMSLALLFLFHPLVWNMLTERAALIKDYDQERFSTQKEAFNSFLQNLLGWGPGQSEVILEYATHNLYLRVLYELGIIGIIGLGSLLIAVGRSLIRYLRIRKPYGPALTAIIIALLAMSFFIDSLHWRHLFVFLGLALSESK